MLRYSGFKIISLFIFLLLDLVNNQRVDSFRGVLDAIRDEYIPELPPGGGLDSK